MTLLRPTNSNHHLSRQYTFRTVVLASFARSREDVSNDFAGFNHADWESQLTWLDVSGLALYFLDRLTTLDLETLLPPNILTRLRNNLADNRERNAALLREAVEINRSFQQENILYSNVKGVTLVPDSVPDYGLRCQLDLDFLVAAEHGDKARLVLEKMGYQLHCVSGHTWDFRTGTSEVASLRDLYKAKPQRTAELHLVRADGVLERTYPRMIAGMPFFVFSPVDLYLAQSKHLFKHLSGAHTRVAWLLEARRHMLARHADKSFWSDVAKSVTDDPRAAIALGVVTILLEDIFGDQPPEYLARLTAETVTQPVRLWLQRYGQRTLLADIPGTKLYLLLLAVLPTQFGASPSDRTQHLAPLHRPPMITRGYAGESTSSRMKRYWIQLRYILFRLRFHCVAGADYFLESYRFHRLLKGLDC